MFLIRRGYYLSEIQKVFKLNLRTKGVRWHAQISLILILIWVGARGPGTLTAVAKLLNGEFVQGGKGNFCSPSRNAREIVPWAGQKIFLWGPFVKGTARYWANLPSLILEGESTSVQLCILLAGSWVGQDSFWGGIPRMCSRWRLCCTAQQTSCSFGEHHQALTQAGAVVALFTLGFVSFLRTYTSVSLMAASQPNFLVLCAFLHCLDLDRQYLMVCHI